MWFWFGLHPFCLLTPALSLPPPLQVLFIILFGIHPFVPPEQISSGRSCIMIVIENSLQGKLLLPEWALQQMPGAVDLLKKVGGIRGVD